MGLLVYFELVERRDTEVEYAFGPDTTRLDRRLTIDTAAEIVVPDTDEDGVYRAAATRIVRRARDEGDWPAAGVVQA
jgi:hypothetical protein